MPCNSFHNLKPNFTKLYIFGAGGSGREVAWLAQQAWGTDIEIEFLVDTPDYPRQAINGHAIRLIDNVGPENAAGIVFAIGDPRARGIVTARYAAKRFLDVVLVHPRAEISDSVKIGAGTIICAGAILTTNIHIGRHAHINLGCTISHDVVIGDFATLSPGVHVSGHVHIERGAFIGTGASLINGSAQSPLVIGENAIIAAGACVTKSVNRDSMVAGVPATRRR